MSDLAFKEYKNVRAGKGMTLRRLSVRKIDLDDDMGQEVMGHININVGRERKLFTLRSMRPILQLCIVTVFLVSGFSLGLAQGLVSLNNQSANSSGTITDTRLERYSTIVDILDESMFEFSQRPERSRERLALAKETFDLIRQGSGTSGGLIQGLDNTFARADTAITNQSMADFEIQTGLILGGLQRFLYETATREAQDNNVPLAQAYIKRIIEDLNLLEGDKIRLAQAVDMGALQAALEIASGESINTYLTSASDALAQGNQQGAYVSLANAYSGFITVQDSLSMPPSVAQALLTTIQDVVAQKPEAAQNIAALQADVGNYIQFNESVLQQFNDDLSGQQQNAGLANQAALAGQGQAGQQASNANPVAGQAGSIQNAVAQELAQQTGNAEVANTGQQQQQGLQGLRGLDGQGALAGQAGQAGQAQNEGLETVRSPLGSGAGLAAGVQESAQQAINGAVDNAVSGVTLGAPSLAGNRGQNANNGLSLGTNGVNGLNNGNGQQLGLQGGTGLSVDRSGSNNTARNTARTSSQVPSPAPSFLEGFWNGWPKAIAMLLLALASFIPLYLLQLAFGSGSSHWLWVRLAVFLLLLPLMLEGVASLGSVLADVTGISALGMLKPFTPSGGVLGQIIWAVTSLIAIATLCFGLWGICKQFGLVGQGDAEDDAVVSDDADIDAMTDAEFQTNPSPMTERFTLEEGPAGTVMDMGNETVIEWEDEF